MSLAGPSLHGSPDRSTDRATLAARAVARGGQCAGEQWTTETKQAVALAGPRSGRDPHRRGSGHRVAQIGRGANLARQGRRSGPIRPSAADAFSRP